MSTRTISGGDEGGRRRVVSVAPHAAHHKANRAVLRQPLDILHHDRTSLGRHRLDVPEQNVKIDRRRLQVVGV